MQSLIASSDGLRIGQIIREVVDPCQFAVLGEAHANAVKLRNIPTKNPDNLQRVMRSNNFSMMMVQWERLN